MSEQTTRSDATLDPAEIERFGRLAAEWWDNNGNFRTLHLIGPARLTFLRDASRSISRQPEVRTQGT